LQENGVFSSR